MNIENYKIIIQDIKNYISLEKEAGLDEFMMKPIQRHQSLQQNTSEDFIVDKKKALDELRHKASVCKECDLSESRRNMVFGEGDPDARLMFIGEAPGLQEDIQGRPFVGKAGSLLTKIIEAIDLKREDVYIANCLKCRPQQNRNPMPSEIIACREFFMKQIEIIRPKVVCCLGKFAAQTVLMTDESITRLRGKFYDFRGTNHARNADSNNGNDISNVVKVVPTFHPAYLLRNPQEKRLVWEDMKRIRDYLKEAK